MAVNRAMKSIHSIRLSIAGLRQLKELSQTMGRSESSVVEIAMDRMYREEVRYGIPVSEDPTSIVCIDDHREEQ